MSDRSTTPGNARSRSARGNVVIDMFAGPGGWSEGLRTLGMTDFGIEWDDAASSTRYAAGHATWQADLRTVDPLIFRAFDPLWGLIASPPCQSFSVAGKRQGLDDERGELVWLPLSWIATLRPEWVALEQVPEVLPIWKRTAQIIEAYGYSTWTGILNAADFGVPQTRERAILMAHRRRPVTPPEPTHAKNEQANPMFGVGRKKWITMAEALGWGLTRTPAGTVCANSGRQGGSSPLDGGSGARKRYYDAMQTPGHWAWRRPATAVCGDARIFEPKYRKGTERAGENSIAVTTEEALVLQSFRRDYPVAGATEKVKQQQIGNAIPPVLAAAIIASLVGVPNPSYSGDTT